MATEATEKVESKVEDVVNTSDLAKSIELLEKALAPKAAAEKVEKSVIGTGGGLQAKTPSDGDINVEVKPDDEEDDPSPLEAAEKEDKGIPIADGTISGDGGSAKKALEGETLIPTTDEEFAKSLSAAFAEASPLVDAAKGSEFAKSLVMSTIEGLSVTCEEITKSLSESETRQTARIEMLEKALNTVVAGVNEILDNVKTVAKAPVRPVAKSVQVLEKSISAGPERLSLSKAQVSERLLGMAREGKVDAFAISRFESTGIIDPALLAEITTKGTGR